MSWQRLEKGILTGCTISVVLFLMGMNQIINAAKRKNQTTKDSLRDTPTIQQRVHG